MKAGDKVRVREVLPVEWPDLCADRDCVLLWLGDPCTVLGVDEDGLVVVMPDGLADDWTGWSGFLEGEPAISGLVVPAAALEPVPPPLPDGWTVERLGHRATLLAPNGLRAARIEGGGMYLWSTEYHAPADLLAALVHFVAVAEVTRG